MLGVLQRPAAAHLAAVLQFEAGGDYRLKLVPEPDTLIRRKIFLGE